MIADRSPLRGPPASCGTFGRALRERRARQPAVFGWNFSGKSTRPLSHRPNPPFTVNQKTYLVRAVRSPEARSPDLALRPTSVRNQAVANRRPRSPPTRPPPGRATPPHPPRRSWSCGRPFVPPRSLCPGHKSKIGGLGGVADRGRVAERCVSWSGGASRTGACRGAGGGAEREAARSGRRRGAGGGAGAGWRSPAGEGIEVCGRWWGRAVVEGQERRRRSQP
jgi:hypothetical protein